MTEYLPRFQRIIVKYTLLAEVPAKSGKRASLFPDLFSKHQSGSAGRIHVQWIPYFSNLQRKRKSVWKKIGGKIAVFRFGLGGGNETNRGLINRDSTVSTFSVLARLLRFPPCNGVLINKCVILISAAFLFVNAFIIPGLITTRCTGRRPALPSYRLFVGPCNVSL